VARFQTEVAIPLLTVKRASNLIGHPTVPRLMMKCLYRLELAITIDYSYQAPIYLSRTLEIPPPKKKVETEATSCMIFLSDNLFFFLLKQTYLLIHATLLARIKTFLASYNGRRLACPVKGVPKEDTVAV